MRIAIIGGGAAGLCTAHLLDRAHQVTLFERQALLGGNIRTLGRNVTCTRLPAGVTLDAGVIEFGRSNFPTFHQLMADLDVDLVSVPGTTSLNLPEGRRLCSPGNLQLGEGSRLRRLAGLLRLLPLATQRRAFYRRTGGLTADQLHEHSMGQVLRDDTFSLWLRLLLMYSYSTPLAQVDELPAALAVPMLRDFLQDNDWTAIRGGAYTYVERILERFHGQVHTRAEITGVRRSPTGVCVQLGAEQLDFDAVVLACTPDQVLPLLADPSAAEQRRFGSWQASHATTVVHADPGLYDRRGIDYYSEFDLFTNPDGTGGYNAYLNRLNQVPTEANNHYGLAFSMDHELDEAHVIHRQHHTTPGYTVAALRSREEVIATNGENHTYHAGAWLGDGLHEGAVTSAQRISHLLGGRSIGEH